MKNFYLVLIVLLFSSACLFAQQQGISIGGNVHFPVGEWSDFADLGFGGSATYEHPIGRNLLGVVYTGYTYFPGVIESTNWTMVPLVAGVKAYINSKQDWYFVGLIGVNFITHSTSFGDASSTEFAANGNFGYELKTSEKSALDFSVGFVFISDQSFIGARVAYIFKL
jgi:hypothetical protein